MDNNDVASLHGELKRVNTKIDHLTDLFKQAAHGDGFPRCARQGNRLDHIERSVDLCHGRVSGMKKWLWAGVAAIAATLFNFVWERVKHS